VLWQATAIDTFALLFLFAHVFEIPHYFFIIMFAFASGRPVWHLLACFAALSFLCSSAAFWLGTQRAIASEQYPDSLKAIFSTQTIDALNQDIRLRNALLSLTEAIAQSSSDLGERLRLEGLQSFGTNLTDSVNGIRNKQQSELKRRDLQDDISGTFRDLTGAGDLGGFNLTGGLAGVLGSLGDLMAGSFGTPALFLGIGLGYVDAPDDEQTNHQQHGYNDCSQPD
jgi:hypothetical protein